MKSWQDIQKAHRERGKDTLGHFIIEKEDQAHGGQLLFLTSPSDLGVCRNGGRRGSSFAPQAILNTFLTCRPPLSFNPQTPPFININQASSLEDELNNFDRAQAMAAEKIGHGLKNFQGQNIIHLGGGHDHIYPLLYACQKSFSYKHLKVLNIDAHLDTRIDDFAHSGTPFRQFSHTCQTEFTLYQLGIRPYSNGPTLYRPLPRGNMKILNSKGPLLSTLHENIILEDGDFLILSLDCDALSSSVMEGVSAVNHHGFSLDPIMEVFSWYYQEVIKNKQKSLIGLYEYNPLYDNLSQKGARALAALIYLSFFN